MYMQPFCSTTTGCVGASKVRSPKPSETNTITFCRSPFGSAITSCANTGDGCCPAQLGSADMLISLGFGTTPSNRTMPFTWAVPFVVVAGEGPAAFTTPTHIASKSQSETVIATTKAKFFAVMIGSSMQDSAFAQLVSLASVQRRPLLDRRRRRGAWPHRGERFFISAAIPSREHEAVLVHRPASDRGTCGLALLAGKFSQIHSVAEGSIACQERLGVRSRSDGAFVVREHRRGSQTDCNGQYTGKEFAHIFLLCFLQVAGTTSRRGCPSAWPLKLRRPVH